MLIADCIRVSGNRNKDRTVQIIIAASCLSYLIEKHEIRMENVNV